MNHRLLRAAAERTAASYDEAFSALQIEKFTLALPRLGPACETGLWLDAGCGTGLLGDHTGYPLVGVDWSPGMVSRALERGMSSVCADLGRLPFADSTFDGAFCFAALAGQALPTALGALHRVLKPTGPLLLTLLPHDIPRGLERLTHSIGFTLTDHFACGQDVGFVVRRHPPPPLSSTP